MRIESGASENSKDRLDYLSKLSLSLSSLTSLSLSLCFPLFQQNGYVLNLSSEPTQLKFLSADFQV
jgi:hypothetical protein